MNLFNIINEIEKVDPDFKDKISPRRDAIKNMTSFGSKVAVAALPMAVASLFKKANAQSSYATTRSVTEVLNFALQLEYFEDYLYTTGNGKAGLIPSASAYYFTVAGAQEHDHVLFLQGVLGSSASAKPADSSYDLTAGGAFPDILTNYNTFLAVSQVVEDTGVRAYKGQAPYLLGNQVVLSAALSIHAVEARHASALRSLRGISSWINSTSASSNDTGIGASVNGNYAGATPENTTTQGPVNILNLPSVESSSSTNFTVAAAAFDEPLTTSEVAALVAGFGVMVS
jgi:hypothetical protein